MVPGVLARCGKSQTSGIVSEVGYHLYTHTQHEAQVKLMSTQVLHEKEIMLVMFND